MIRIYRNKTINLLVMDINGNIVKLGPGGIMGMDEATANRYMQVLELMPEPEAPKPIVAPIEAPKPLLQDSPGMPLTPVLSEEPKKELLVDTVKGETLKEVKEEPVVPIVEETPKYFNKKKKKFDNR